MKIVVKAEYSIVYKCMLYLLSNIHNTYVGMALYSQNIAISVTKLLFTYLPLIHLAVAS